jgi:hypothetical protein
MKGSYKWKYQDICRNHYQNNVLEGILRWLHSSRNGNGKTIVISQLVHSVHPY